MGRDESYVVDPWQEEFLSFCTDLLPAPLSKERVEFRWIVIKDSAESITEFEKGSGTERVIKHLELEPDLWELHQELFCGLGAFHGDLLAR